MRNPYHPDVRNLLNNESFRNFASDFPALKIAIAQTPEVQRQATNLVKELMRLQALEHQEQTNNEPSLDPKTVGFISNLGVLLDMSLLVIDNQSQFNPIEMEALTKKLTDFCTLLESQMEISLAPSIRENMKLVSANDDLSQSVTPTPTPQQVVNHQYFIA